MNWDNIVSLTPQDIGLSHDTTLIISEIVCAAHEQAILDNEWAQNAGVSRRQLADFLYHCKSAKLDTVMRLADAVGYKIVAVKRESGD